MAAQDKNDPIKYIDQYALMKDPYYVWALFTAEHTIPLRAFFITHSTLYIEPVPIVADIWKDATYNPDGYALNAHYLAFLPYDVTLEFYMSDRGYLIAFITHKSGCLVLASLRINPSGVKEELNDT